MGRQRPSPGCRLRALLSVMQREREMTDCILTQRFLPTSDTSAYTCLAEANHTYLPSLTGWGSAILLCTRRRGTQTFMNRSNNCHIHTYSYSPLWTPSWPHFSLSLETTTMLNLVISHCVNFYFPDYYWSWASFYIY